MGLEKFAIKHKKTYADPVYRHSYVSGLTPVTVTGETQYAQLRLEQHLGGFDPAWSSLQARLSLRSLFESYLDE